LEIDFSRLLRKCEDMIAANKSSDVDGKSISSADAWRREKYVDALEEKLAELRKLNVCQPSDDDLNEFARRVQFLRGIVAAERLSSPLEKLMASEILSPTTIATARGNKNKTKEIHLRARANYAREVRRNLFNETDGTSKPKDEGKDFETLTKYHHDMQEKVAKELLNLTKNLKQNTTLAGHIIKKDVETLESTKRLAEKNMDKLEKSNSVVADFVRRSCQYWLWITLAIVLFTFLWMVLFIRMFPKKNYS